MKIKHRHPWLDKTRFTANPSVLSVSSCPHPTSWSTSRIVNEAKQHQLDNSIDDGMFINQFNQAKEHVSNQHLSQISNFIALLFYLISGALERSTFSSGIDSKDSKLRQGLILWPKLAASSNTVSEKWRQQRFNSTFALHLKADSHHNSS